MKQVHQFKNNGYNIVLDVCSGSVHVVDDLVYDLIALYEKTPKEEVLQKLAAQYPDKPFYVIPTRLYGLMAAEEFIEDAEDAIEGWKETGMNPFHFEGEETAIRVMRTVSHRKWLKSQG